MSKEVNSDAEIVEKVSTVSTEDHTIPKVFQQFQDEEVVLKNVDKIINDFGLEDERDGLVDGAKLANDPNYLNDVDIDENTRTKISREISHPIKSLSAYMIFAALATSFAAVNFGMDESAVGGAQLQFNKQFHITDTNIQGLVIASPYLSAAVIGSPLTVLLNKYFGRKEIIMVACFIGISGSLWQAFSNGLAALLVGRLYLGVGMGLNSSIVPIYVAECSPAINRGAMLMLWQTFIALGVCLGSVFNRAFVEISNQSIAWRLMIGSSFVPPLICWIMVLLPPESPRWLISKNRGKQSLDSMIKLRKTKLSGYRDFYILNESLKYENEVLSTNYSLTEQFLQLFKTKRNRFAVFVSFLGIFGQQYGGVNILVSYTTTILTGAGIDSVTAIAGSIGIGGGCFLATFISTQLIDRYGRRRMLLVTLPFEAICLFWLGGVLNVTDNKSRLGAGLTAMYVYVFAYGLGIGPISFTLVAETPTLKVRAAHSAFLMAINWLLDFCLSMTWPKMNETMTTSGGLYFYGAWNVVLVFATFLFIPETKRYTLEELDHVFSEGLQSFSGKQLRRLQFYKRR